MQEICRIRQRISTRFVHLLKFCRIHVENVMFLDWSSVPYSWKYRQELNLVLESQIAIHNITMSGRKFWWIIISWLRKKTTKPSDLILNKFSSSSAFQLYSIIFCHWSNDQNAQVSVEIVLIRSISCNLNYTTSNVSIGVQHAPCSYMYMCEAQVMHQYYHMHSHGNSATPSNSYVLLSIISIVLPHTWGSDSLLLHYIRPVA